MRKIILITKLANMIFKIYCSSTNSFIEYFPNNFHFESNFADIKIIFEVKNIKHFLYMYFNKTNIHRILYESEQMIEIKAEYANSISDYFYIDLLIKDDTTLINYVYSMNLIEKINDFINKKNLVIKNIILSKISLDFIYNYKQTDKYNCKIDKNKLTLIEEKNKQVIREKNNALREINKKYNNIEDILTKKIDIIYIDIFIGLIQNDKFSDYDYVFNIINQLDFDSIYFTNNMFKELCQLFDKDLIKPYVITIIEDLFDTKKINFYYILLKYILKDSLYIYQMKILLQTRILIINNIKNNLDNIWKLYINEENTKKERINYIIRTTTDSDYYYNKFLNYKKMLSEVLNYYEKYLFKTKREEIEYILNYINEKTKTKKIKKKKDEFISNIFNDYKKAKYMNERYPIINYMFGIDNSSMSEYQINKYTIEWNILEIMIKKKKYKKFRKDTNEKLLNYFQDQNNKNILLNIFTEKDLDYYIREKTNLANEGDNEEEIRITKQNDDNENEIIEVQAMTFSNIRSVKKSETSIIRESYYIQSEDISNTSNIRDENTKREKEKEKEEDISISGSISIVKEVEKELFEILLKSSKYKILEYIKSLGKYKRPQFIIILSNDYILVSGEDKRLHIYDFLYNNIMHIKLNSDKFPYDITENIHKANTNTNTNTNTELIISSLENIFYLNLNIKNNECNVCRYESDTISSLSLFQVGENKTIISGLKGIISIVNLFLNNNNVSYHKQKYKIPYTQGILIDEKIIAFTSNSIIPKGQNKIVFYNWEKNKVFHEVSGFSFSMASNGLCSINFDNTVNNKIVLCACRKYNQETKNGILLICLDLKNEEFYHYFYDTKNFEVFCFCQISIVNNENPIYDDISYKKNIKIINTKYFFVGGFDENRKEGLIKLYRIVYNNTMIKNTRIEFLQNIKIEEKNGFEGFKGAISCIKQSNIIGNILITCWDGNVHLLKPPNIDYFLSCDK